MYRIIALFTFSIIFISCDNGDSSVNPPDENDDVFSMFSLMNIDENTTWLYDKFTKERTDEVWSIEGESEAEYETSAPDSLLYVFKATENETNDFPVTFSVDSSRLYLNDLSVNNALANGIIQTLDYDKLIIADLERDTWENDTITFEDLQIDANNTITGQMFFSSERLTDTVVTFNENQETVYRFSLTANIDAYHQQFDMTFRIFPNYEIWLIDKVGIYRFSLYNKFNTTLAVEEIDYRLKDMIE